jgi:DNA-directed RNA polymerase subunit E'/Rpb7
VSNHLIPDDFDFVSTDEPAFVSADEEVRVQAGAEVRMRIVGTRMDATEIVRARPQKAVGLGTLQYPYASPQKAVLAASDAVPGAVHAASCLAPRKDLY